MCEPNARFRPPILGRRAVIVVVAGVYDDACRRHFYDAGGERGHELAVVRDENRRARKFFKRGVERFDAFHVEVIGRLVHQQDIGSLEREFLHFEYLPVQAVATTAAVFWSSLSRGRRDGSEHTVDFEEIVPGIR
jgi:hypothetical protein